MPRTIDRNVVMLGWVSFFTDMASAMVTPLVPVFIVSVLHEGIDKLGLIVAAATLLSYLLRLFSGYLCDRYGIVKPLVAGGYILSALAKPLLYFSQGWQSVAVLRGAERIGKGVRSAPKDVMIAHYAHSEREGRTFGFHKTLDIAGELAGALLVFVLLLWLGTGETALRTIFLLTLIPGAFGVALLLFVRDIPAAPRKAARFALEPEDRAVVKTMLPYGLFVFFAFGDAFVTLRAVDQGFDTAVIPLLFIVSTGVQTLLSYPLGWLIDRAGYRRVMLLALSAGVAMQLLLAAGGAFPVWCAYAMLGLFTVASLNANRALISRRSVNRGSVYGIFYAAVALSASAGAYVSGIIWEGAGSGAALGFALAGTAATLAGSLIAGVRKSGEAAEGF